MDFAEVDQRYGELKQQYEAGTLTEVEFDAQLLDMMVRDGENRWWAKSRESGEWHYHDAVSGDWVRADPPIRPAAKPAPPPAPRSAQTPSWAAVVPPTAAMDLGETPDPVTRTAANVTRTPVAPTTGAQTQPATSYYAHDFGPLPELGGGLKVIFYLLSFFVPVIGIILFFVYHNKPVPQDREAARVFLILGIVSLIIFGACGLVFLFFEALMT